MISSIGSQTNLVNNITELSWKLASSIILAHGFFNLNNLSNCSLERLPHTVQQYSRIGFMRELYNNFPESKDCKFQVRYLSILILRSFSPIASSSLTSFKNILLHIKVVGNSCFFHRDYKYHWSKFNPRHKWRAFLIPSYGSALSKHTPHN